VYIWFPRCFERFYLYVRNRTVPQYFGVFEWVLLIDMFLTQDALFGFKDKSILTYSVRLWD